jgi:hypothetical protein
MNQLVGRTRDGKPFLELRLEPGNIERLKQGQPIAKRIEDMFPDGCPRRLDLYITYSETPIADARELKNRAEVALDERTHVSEQKRPHCPECKSAIEQLGVWRNESPMAIAYCAVCGCVFGMVPAEVARGLKP